MYIYMAETFCCLPETTTTLLIDYIPIQNIFGFKKFKKCKKSQWFLKEHFSERLSQISASLGGFLL